DDPVEMEGVRRAQARAAEADLVLWVVDASTASRGETGTLGRGKNELGQLRWLVRNKSDLLQGFTGGAPPGARLSRAEPKGRFNNSLKGIVNEWLSQRSERLDQCGELGFNVSAEMGEGVSELLNALEAQAADFLGGAESALITRARHRTSVQDAVAALRRAAARPLAEREDLLAEELRVAARALGRLTGRVDVEDILDVIFRDFCIGK
ncbi:MAG TPA: hypothetical protein VG270_08110, partial [Pseudolabrys sp.]|nr:hypothetical protein [Pseudolabrys sp.]